VDCDSQISSPFGAGDWSNPDPARPEFIPAWPSNGNGIRLHLKRLDRTDGELICSSLNAEEALSRQFHELVNVEPQLLTHHFTRAGSFGEAIPHWISAGRWAAGMPSHEEAVQHFQLILFS
jgi:hypothetical protein